MIDTEKLEQRGRMAYLKEDISRLSRERDTLLRPLRDRINKALPRDEPPQETARALDTAAAVGELQSVADINTRLDAAISEYNTIAGLLILPDIRRTAY
jgi:hypothetical protein